MPLFTYRATNDDNKEVRGSIESFDELGARKALEDLNLEVHEISEASRMKPSAPVASAVTEPQMPSFAFEGKDISGAVRRGTVQAPTKYEAFKRLRDDQKLFLSMLSPVGVLPQYKDPELDQWQRGVKMDTQKPASVASSVLKAPPPRPTIGFTNTELASVPNLPTPAAKTAPENYHPLSATLRLYAGWLLAWYGLFVAIGYYSSERALPWDIPFVRGFYLSPLIFSFIVAIFIFLLLSAIHKIIRGGLPSGAAFGIVGIVLFIGVQMLA